MPYSRCESWRSEIFNPKVWYENDESIEIYLAGRTTQVNNLRFRLAISGLASLAVALAGCGLPSPDEGSGFLLNTQQTGLSRSSSVQGTGSNGALLYVSDNRRTKVEVLTYPQGHAVAELSTYPDTVTGLCTDPNGNVWVAETFEGQSVLYEYAHGGTSSIAQLSVPGDRSQECTVDPVSGDLAVAHDASYVLYFRKRLGLQKRMMTCLLGSLVL